MTISPKTVSTFNIGAEAYQTYTALKKPALRLAFFALFLPILLLELILSQVGKPTIQSIKTITKQLITQNSDPNIQSIFEASSSYFAPYLVTIVMFFLICFSAYLGLIRLIFLNIQDKSGPLSPFAAFTWALRQFFPKGFVFLIFFSIFSLERFLWGPFPIFSMLLLMTPVLYTAENFHLRSSLSRSLFLKYVNPAVSTKFNAALTLIIFGAFLLMLAGLIQLFSRMILNLDQWVELGREIWTLPFFNFPFTCMFFVTHAFSAIANTLLILCLPFFTVSLYLRFLPKTIL